MPRKKRTTPAGKPKVCPVCGTEFVASPPWRKYCTPRCAQEVWVGQIMSRKAGQRVGKHARECEVCGGQYQGYSYQRYCEKPECKATGVAWAVEAQRERREKDSS